jgi:serine protease
MKNIFRFLFLTLILALSLSLQTFAQLSEAAILPPEPKLGRTCEVLSKTLRVRFKPYIQSQTQAQNSLVGTDLSIVQPLLDNKSSVRYNVKLRNQILYDKPNSYAKIMKAEEPLLRTFIVQYKADVPPEIYAKRLLKSNHDIEIAEPYHLDKILFKPNDSLIDSQNMLRTIHALEAWNAGLTGDTSVVIGISDNGVFQNHEDLINSIAPNWNEIPGNGKDDDSNHYVDDYMGYNFAYIEDHTQPGNTFNPNDSHGTNVAGIADATVNNIRGIAGVAYHCRFFPIKAALNSDSQYLLYGYESIIYAGVRGFKVLNCSWGSQKQFSDIDQKVIDLAVANDVAIVAAGGNLQGDNQYVPFYPAGYKGVLGVGEVNQYDEVDPGSSLGAHVSIMAPGGGNWYTTNDGSYSNSGSGTSYSSPVVAGAVALARAKYPELSAVQSLEFVRQCNDKIVQQNDPDADVIPGRINLMKVDTINPMSIPSIRLLSVELYKNGTLVDRSMLGETITLKINAFNYLGPASNITFVLKNANDPNNSVRLIDSVVNLASCDSNSSFVIQPFKININSENEELIFLRVDIYADNNYHDFFLIPFTPTSEVANFSNNVINFSAGDRGTFGHGGPSSNLQGFGFVYKNYGNQLYTNAGIMATESGSKLVSSIFGNGIGNNDFVKVKAFVLPDTNIGIVNDSYANGNDKIGLEIKQTFTFPSDNSPVVKSVVDVKNVSDSILNDVAVGYFFDWDIGPNAYSNTVRSFPEAIPQTQTPIVSAAELARYTGDYPVVGAVVYSSDSSDSAQNAGLLNTLDNHPHDRMIKSLNSGGKMQDSSIGDISMVIGMKFNGNFQPGVSKECVFFIGADDSEQALASVLSHEVLEIVSVKDNTDLSNELNIYPQPSSGSLLVEIQSSEPNLKLSLIDIFGREVIHPINVINDFGRMQIPIDLYNGSSGIYFLKITGGKLNISKPVIVVK